MKHGVETIRGKSNKDRRTLDDWGRALVLACERRWLEATAMWRALELWDAAHPRFPLLAPDA